MELGHLQECNKQLFEDQLRRVIVEAKERVQKAKSQPGVEGTAGERPVLDTQISAESITIGVALQQVMCLVSYKCTRKRISLAGFLKSLQLCLSFFSF